MIPEIQYARSGEVAIAYQVVGDGPMDVVFARGFAGDLLTTWEQPLLAQFVEDMGRFARVVLLDKRGTGLSDGFREPPTLETRMDDLRAVMDAVGSERAVICCGQEAAWLAVLFAATYPERTTALVLFDPHACGLRTDDYPWARDEEGWRAYLAEVRARWGSREYLEGLARETAPSHADDPEFLDWFVRHMRRSLSPGAAVAFLRASMGSDVRDILPAVRVPTLVLGHPEHAERCRYVADRIRGSRFVMLPATLRGFFPWIDADVHEAAITETRRFLEQVESGRTSDRVLATVLFTDIVGSSELAARLGDRDWRSLLERHHALVRRRLAEFRGEELDTAGDGFLAAFDGPGRAIACARAAIGDVHELGIELRAGVHTGECERHEHKLAGIALSAGARIAGLARPGEVLVSSTVRDLVAGSGFEFADRGMHELKGVPGEWRLAAVSS